MELKRYKYIDNVKVNMQISNKLNLIVMKKLFAILIFISVFTLPAICQSLSGYSKTEVKSMVARFNTWGTQLPQITSVWFDKSIIKNIILLLNSRDSQRHQVDGLRIYYAYDNSVPAKQTVVIVATTNGGQTNSQSAEHDDYHYDYYKHDPAAPLFHMSIPINGKTCHDTCKGGALLYTKSGKPDDVTCDMSSPHYLSRSMAEDMVISFARLGSRISSQSEWFDLDMINGFTDEFDGNPAIDGIRIYFAKHLINDSYTFYRGMDTFVIVPTTGSTTDPDFHRDFFDCHFASTFFKNSIYNLKNRINTRLKKRFKYLAKKRGAQLKRAYKQAPPYGGQDNGELCPDNCD
jgi:hypothetical protein